jgi:hypothetical protein
MDRPSIARAISPPGRDRSLSPRSKEVQREMQAAREQRKGGDRKGEAVETCEFFSVVLAHCCSPPASTC